MPGQITRQELLRALDAGNVTLVEALPEEHYAAEHLPGAVNLPAPLSASEAARIAPDLERAIVVYCSGPSCSRSTVAAAAFRALGYLDVRVYPGGKADWFAAGLPMEHARAAG